MISIGLQRDVPQYIAIPWLITWVIARTVSANQTADFQRLTAPYIMSRCHQNVSVWVNVWNINKQKKTSSINAREGSLNDKSLLDRAGEFESIRVRQNKQLALRVNINLSSRKKMLQMRAVNDPSLITNTSRVKTSVLWAWESFTALDWLYEICLRAQEKNRQLKCRAL